MHQFRQKNSQTILLIPGKFWILVKSDRELALTLEPIFTCKMKIYLYSCCLIFFNGLNISIINVIFSFIFDEFRMRDQNMTETEICRYKQDKSCYSQFYLNCSSTIQMATERRTGRPATTFLCPDLIFLIFLVKPPPNFLFQLSNSEPYSSWEVVHLPFPCSFFYITQKVLI